jgi:hypothetical protein
MTNLTPLIERVEAASGPDREIDVLIMRWVENIGGPAEKPLPYTGSIDAAMTLVGDDCFRVERHPMYGVYAFVGDDDAYAATPALALVAAALRALQHQKEAGQ